MHVINVDGSMPGVLGGVSEKVYKEVVKTPNARKRLITASPEDAVAHDEGWPDLDGLAAVEVTSEDKDHPVESALAAAEVRGWRAADSGTQTIRLIFDQPQRAQSSSPDTRSKCSSMICFLLESLQRPHIGRLWKIG